MLLEVKDKKKIIKVPSYCNPLKKKKKKKKEKQKPAKCFLDFRAFYNDSYIVSFCMRTKPCATILERKCVCVREREKGREHGSFFFFF